MENAILDMDLLRDQQKIPIDPTPIIYQMRKPQLKKKKQRKSKPSVMTVAPRSDAKDHSKSTKNVENEKKIEALTKANQQLKESKDMLNAEIDELKKQQKLIEMERDRILQLWTISKNDLSRQKDYSIGIEKRIHNMSTAHSQQISLLKKRIRALTLNMHMYCAASTQTDAILDSEEKRNVAVQTVKELTPERVIDVLRGGDRQLAEHIAGIVKEKLHAESDHQRALVQLEQRLKDENDIQIRKLKEEKLKQFEEISRLHRQQISEFHTKYFNEKEQNNQQIIDMQMEIRMLNEKIENFERESKILKGDLLKCESEKRILYDENRALNDELQKRRLESNRHRKDAAIIRELKEKLLKSEDVKEIVLGEFRRLEHERDELANAIADGIRRVEGINRSRTQRFIDELAEAENEANFMDGARR